MIRHHALEGRLLVKEEGEILGGCLTFGSKRANSAMKSIDQTVGVACADYFSTMCVERIVQSGYSRFAVFESPDRIRGFLHMKDLVGVNHLDQFTADDLLNKVSRPVLCLESRTPLMTLLNTFKLGKKGCFVNSATRQVSHCYFVRWDNARMEACRNYNSRRCN